MRLTRRDAIAALTAAGVAAGGGVAVRRTRDDEPASAALSEGPIAVLVAAAEVLYPSELEGVRPFVERYVRGRADERPGHVNGVVDAVGYLDDYAESWYDEGFVDLDRSSRDEALRRMGADTASPDPAGSDVERVRYYVVNELLFALYATPTGGDLLGLENPQGHPGGSRSYRRGPHHG